MDDQVVDLQHESLRRVLAAEMTRCGAATLMAAAFVGHRIGVGVSDDLRERLAAAEARAEAVERNFAAYAELLGDAKANRPGSVLVYDHARRTIFAVPTWLKDERDAARREAAEQRKRAEKAEARADNLSEQIDRLARFIMEHVPGEPSQNQGAVDTAMRIIMELRQGFDAETLEHARQRADELQAALAVVAEAVHCLADAWRDGDASQREAALAGVLSALSAPGIAAARDELAALRECEAALKDNSSGPCWWRERRQAALQRVAEARERRDG